MKTNRIIVIAATGLCAVGLVPIAVIEAAPAKSKTDATYIQKVADGETDAAGLAEKKGKKGWWARSWSQKDGSGFFGKPKLTNGTENTDANIIIRYTRYSTEYDVEFHSPLWGAYTISKETVENELSGERTEKQNPDFARPGKFFQESLVVTLSQKLGVDAASHGTFTSTYDPRYPFLKAGAGVTADAVKKAKADRSIQRGHMVPNNAMKSQGTIEEGQTAQIESFSVANIVPQMAKSNSPTWANLEDSCFDWANELGQVWLFVGPVYRDRENATYIRKSKGDVDTILPSPDELYYVVIGERNGKTAAIGFLLPHEPISLDFKAAPYPVSVDVIESKTGLNFMPDLGEPNAIEESFDRAWILTPKRKDTPQEED